MPRFKVVVEGKDIEAATHQGPPIRGFFATRVVVAPSVEEAQAHALALIERDWTEGKFSAWKQMPALAAVEVAPVSLLGALVTRKSGYVFHRGL